MNLAFASLFLLFAVAPPVWSPDPDTPVIKDRVSLFSKNARRQAQQVIDETYDRYHITLGIETVKTVPGIEPRKMSPSKVKDELRKYAEDCAQTTRKEIHERDTVSERKDLLYVLILQEPKHVLVVGVPGSVRNDITPGQRDRIERYLSKELASNPDHALIGACGIFRDIVRINERPAAAPLTLVHAITFSGAMVGVWLFLNFLRRRVVIPALPIYQPAMLGSVFGNPAGYWINDRLYRAECVQPVASPPELVDATQAPESPQVPEQEPAPDGQSGEAI